MTVVDPSTSTSTQQHHQDDQQQHGQNDDQQQLDEQHQQQQQRQHKRCAARGSFHRDDGFTPLAVALQQGHDRIVALLLENDNTSKVKLPALHIAAKKDDVRSATLLLESEQNPNVTSKSGFTPLHIAAHYGNENIGQLLIEKGANVNFQARHNISPLHVAAKWGRVKLVELLLDRGAIIDCRTRDLLTPLHCAARSGKCYQDLCARHNISPLHVAAKWGRVKLVELLLDRGAIIDCRTRDLLTPLHCAARSGKCYQDLCARHNISPLHVAAKWGRVKLVELLLDRGAIIDCRTRDFFFSHFNNFVVQSGKCGRSDGGLSDRVACCSPLWPCWRGQTVVGPPRGPKRTSTEWLHPASHRVQEEPDQGGELLLKYHASVDATTESGLAPLHVAAFMGCINIVIFLIQQEGHLQMAALLKENGSEPIIETTGHLLRTNQRSAWTDLNTVQRRGLAIQPLHTVPHALSLMLPLLGWSKSGSSETVLAEPTLKSEVTQLMPFYTMEQIFVNNPASETLGIMAFIGLTIDPVVMAAVIISMGFNVDIPAHVSYHHFHNAKWTKDGQRQRDDF
ncbi:hypothetical protein niasHT_008418 [Heterodera trifolii]|uniref:Uncharacterized protein n=1 Tax=Heterodera trifolii TaxID=157864 RepID=A0ABD2M294_9BILA